MYLVTMITAVILIALLVASNGQVLKTPSNVVGLAPKVQTKDGPVQGVIELSEDGEIYKYMGIPFARVNPENAFGDAIPVTPWKEVLKADSDQIYCAQREEFFQTLIGSTDCLTINVYVPPNRNVTEKLPVMIWTHGGGFYQGFAAQYMHGPEKLVRHGVIVVTHNYRVGPYGFLCLGTEEVSGNTGLKDSVLAYKWINQNIEAFGGDVNRITLFGQSAGAFAVEFLMLSPKTKGLFHKAIIQSCSILDLRLPKNYEINRTKIFILAYVLGYRGFDLNEVLKFLSKVEPLLLIKTSESLGISYGVCLESDEITAEKILPKHPIDVYKSEEYVKMPLVLGVNNRELVLILEVIEPFIDVNSVLMELQFFLVLGFFKFRNINEQFEAALELRNFYYGNGPLTYDGMIDMFSDIVFTYNMDRTLNMYLNQSSEPIFYYMFAYDGDRNYGKRRMNIKRPGAAHADELSYLFLQPNFGKLTDRDRLMMDRMTKMWTNFAKYTDPTPKRTSLLPVKWEPTTLEDNHYLRIDTDMQTGTRAFRERMEFWDSIHKKYGIRGSARIREMFFGIMSSQ